MGERRPPAYGFGFGPNTDVAEMITADKEPSEKDFEVTFSRNVEDILRTKLPGRFYLGPLAVETPSPCWLIAPSDNRDHCNTVQHTVAVAVAVSADLKGPLQLRENFTAMKE